MFARGSRNVLASSFAQSSFVRTSHRVQDVSKAKCSQRAASGIECRDKIGHPIWRRDFCDEHARLIAKARAFGIEVYCMTQRLERSRMTLSHLPKP